MEEERWDPLPPAPARPVPLRGRVPPSLCLPSCKAAFLQDPRSLGWQTKSLSEATGGRQLIEMHLFALRPGCHLRAALSSQTAKQNSCAAHRNPPWGGACPGGGQKLHRAPRPPIHFVLETQLQTVLTCTRAAGSAGAHLLGTSWGADAQGPQRPGHPSWSLQGSPGLWS